ncbi:MAG: EF-P lysine aminoacylase GenX [Alphaproteobacteria bacterium]|nr:EF-P lysine aminoacylase GenX [Alphaproteobacteria bacterium]
MSHAGPGAAARPLDRDALRARATVLHALRSWLHDHGYLEVPTPVLVPSPAMEATLSAVPAAEGWLRTSPEMALKRVVASGLPRVYELGPCLRVDEDGPWHGREFTLLEWYRVGAHLHDLMDEVEGLVAAAAAALGVPAPGPWRRVSVRALVAEHTGLDLATTDAATLSSRDPDDWDVAFFRRWIEEVEPHLLGPVFVEDWPASQAALARVRQDAAWPTAHRFEAFLGGVELANAFGELTNAAEQRRRFEASAAARRAAGQAPHPVDEPFVDAVGRLPPTAGIALGVDRLVAVLCGWSAIHRGRVG